MPPEIKKTLQVEVANKDFKVQYHEDRDEFELIFVPHLESEGINISSFHIVLESRMIRQMAALLPPLDPESVH
jgi:hypothetical protein